jgi:Protein of unknown function (DUF1302)
MSTCNSRPERRSAGVRIGGLTGWVLALAVVGAVIGLTPTAYSQVPGAVSPGGSTQSQSLMDLIIKGGPAGAWIPHPENPWLQGLRITGLLQNTTGIWENTELIRTNTAPFYAGEEPTNWLATERNFMQVDLNYDLDGNNHFFLRWWGVYEPAYQFEQTFRQVNAGALNFSGRTTGCFPPGIKGVPGLSHCTASSAADYYNQVGFREAWWRLSMGPLRLFTGRQTVTWGESLAFRIADVVNPQDISWNFGFANLEQSRIPQYMLHPILELPEFGWLTQNFAEGIWEPPIQASFSNWIFTDTPNHTYRGVMANGDSVNKFAPSGGRFDINLQTPFGGPLPFPNPNVNTIPGVPTASAWSAYPQGSFAGNLLPPSLALVYRVPGTQLSNSQEGIRFHALIDQLVEATVLYWHGHQYNPATRLQQLAPNCAASFPGCQFAFPGPLMRTVNFYPQLNDVGFTANMPINIPGQLGSMFPFVLRSEGVWQDHTPFANRFAFSGLKYSETINTLVALDADQIYAPWLTSTGGSLTVNLEWNNYTILSPSRWNEYGPLAYQQARHNEESFIFAASTSWWWQSIAPQWVSVYNPDGNTFLLFPNIALVPPWTSQYFMKLQYIRVIGNNIQDDYAGGLLKGKNFILAQFQWNFNLL